MASWSTVLAASLLLAAGLPFAPGASAAEETPEPPKAEAVRIESLGNVSVLRAVPSWSVRLEGGTAAPFTFHLGDLQVVEAPVEAEGVGFYTVQVNGGSNAPGGPRGGENANAPARPAPPPTWTPPHEAVGIERPLGSFRLLRTILDALLFALKALGLLLLPLYHRITGSGALDHPLRARLLALVRERPGLHVAALAEALDAHPKTLAYHLRVLARSRLVRLAREGRTMRAFPPALGPAEEAADASATRARALELLREGHARSRDDLAALLAVTPQAVSYHLKILRRQGKVRVRWMGRRRSYEPA